MAPRDYWDRTKTLVAGDAESQGGRRAKTTLGVGGEVSPSDMPQTRFEGERKISPIQGSHLKM